jgi:autotransporter-associated beta strand protein
MRADIMKRFHFRNFSVTLALALVFARPVSAQPFTWTGATVNGWNSSSNWSPGIPNSPTALVNFTGSGPFYGVNISSSVSAQSLMFSNPTLGYSLTSSAGQILSGLTTINVGASVTGTQTINLANIATGSLLFTGSGPGALTITNNSFSTNSLVIGPNTVIGTPGSGGITVTGSGNTTISGSFASNASPNNQVIGGLTQSGPSRLTLSGNGSNLFGGITLASGYMYWDYSNNTAAKFGGGNLQLFDGGLSLLAHPTIAVTQTVPGGNTTINTGDTELYLYTNSGAFANVILNAGAITRLGTGTLNVRAEQGGAVTTTSTVTNGILGAWAAYNSSTWATKGGSFVAGFTAFGTNVYASGVNTDVTSGGGIPADFTTNTLRFNTPLAAVISGTNTIQSGGILVSSAGGTSSISGGTLQSGAAEFLVHTYGGLTINSALNVNGGLTKTGGAALSLGGPVNWVGGAPLTISYGTVSFTNSLAFASLTEVHFNDRSDSNQVLAFRLPDGQNAASNANIRLTGHSSTTSFNANVFHNFAMNSRITLSGVLSSETGFSAPYFTASSDSSGFVLSGANTFLGNTYVGSGVLGIASNANLGPTANNLVLTGANPAFGGIEFLTNGMSLDHAVQLAGAGRAIVPGSNTNGIDTAVSGAGGLIKVGTGTLLLNNAANTYSGGTIVNEGRLMLGAGTAIPTGSNVTVANGAEFNIGPWSNSALGAIGTVSLNGGGFRVPSGFGDYYVNKLAIGSTGGMVDFNGTSNFRLHLTGSGAGITFAGDSTWNGAGTSRIQNDTAAPIDIYGSNFLSTLTNGIILANGINNQGFRLTGPTNGNYVAAMLLINPGNTANLIADSAGYLKVADMVHLGSGSLTLQNTAAYFRPGTLWYVGSTAISSKPITLGVGGGQIYVNNDGTNLTLSGTIGESSPGQPLLVTGNFTFPAPPVLTVSGANTFTGPVTVAYFGTLSVDAIPNGGLTSPLGRSSSAPANLKLGHPDLYGGTLQYTGPTATTNRGITLVAFANSSYTNVNAVEITAAATNLTIAGQVTGTGGLTKTGPGTLTLSSATNNYSGGTFVDAGRLALGAGTAIPAGSNVTVAYGAEFNTGGLTNQGGADLGMVFLNGGTLRIPPPAATAYYYLNKVVTNYNGGTIDFTGDATASGVVLTNAGASVTINGNSTWTGPNSSFFGNSSFAERPITIAPFATLTSSLSLAGFGPVASNSFRVTGGGTLHLTNTPGYVAFVRVNQGRLRMDDLSGVQPNFFNLTLDAGTLAYGGPTAVSTANFALGAGGGTLEVINAATTLDFNGQISGNETYSLTKTGHGTLILSSPFNFYTGGLIVNDGRLDAVGDYQLGFANPTINAAGTLRYTANSTTERTFTLNNGSLEAPSGLTLNGATVNGGFLRGASTFSLTGGAALNGVTTFSSATININGPATANNFANNGAIMVNSGRIFTMSYATNGAAGRMTVNGTANVSDFVSYGQINVPAGGLLSNSASTSGIVLGGGSTTFVGSISTPGGVINVGTQPMLVRGGLLVNNGAIGNSTGNGQVIVDYGGFAKGAGYYDTIPQTINGGRFSPGNSPGRVTVGSVTMNPGGNYDFEINNAAGMAGPTGTSGLSGWDLTIVSNAINPALSNLTVTATPAQPFTINLVTLRNPSPPDIAEPMANFNSGTVPFSWLAFDVNPAGSVTNWDPSAIVINTSQVMNTFSGTFGIMRDSGNPFQFYITYTPVPEPAFIFAASLGSMLVGRGIIRRRIRSFSLRHHRVSQNR